MELKISLERTSMSRRQSPTRKEVDGITTTAINKAATTSAAPYLK